MADDKRFLCKRCEGVFSSFNSLKQHVSNIHKLKRFCVFCQEVFYNQSALYRHKLKDHANSSRGNTLKRIKCGQCEEIFSKLIHLCKHLQSLHNISIKIEHFTFVSKEMFNKWKQDVERNGNFAFVKNGIRQSRKFISYTLLCHRSGYFVSMRKTEKVPKALVTNKLNFYCSAFATIRESLENGEIHVECCLNHYGHDRLLRKTESQCTNTVSTETANELIKEAEKLTKILMNGQVRENLSIEPKVAEVVLCKLREVNQILAPSHHGSPASQHCSPTNKLHTRFA
uniref:C2H2-type domain-containing protein n=1 Tax=Romanomermis culicivorax TaxID=13658 RepID=A0A915J726_ROMCU